MLHIEYMIHKKTICIPLTKKIYVSNTVILFSERNLTSRVYFFALQKKIKNLPNFLPQESISRINVDVIKFSCHIRA